MGHVHQNCLSIWVNSKHGDFLTDRKFNHSNQHRLCIPMETSPRPQMQNLPMQLPLLPKKNPQNPQKRFHSSIPNNLPNHHLHNGPMLQHEPVKLFRMHPKRPMHCLHQRPNTAPRRSRLKRYSNPNP
jgi:hypothetical protein